MADRPPVTRPAPTRPPTLLGRLVALPFNVFGMLCGALLLSIAIELVGMRFFWPEQGWHHAEHMLDFELTQLSEDFKQSIVLSDPVTTTQRWVAQSYETLFVKTGLQAHSLHPSAPTITSAGLFSSMRPIAQRFNDALVKYAMAAAYITLTFLVRLVVLALSIPLFALTALVALVDGVAQRDIRRFGVGRESGFVYHRARALILPITLLPWGFYLSLPVSLNPLWVLFPAALLLGAAIYVTVSSFKKYL